MDGKPKMKKDLYEELTNDGRISPELVLLNKISDNLSKLNLILTNYFNQQMKDWRCYRCVSCNSEFKRDFSGDMFGEHQEDCLINNQYLSK